MNVFEQLRLSEIDSVVLIENTVGGKRLIKDRFAYAISFCLSGQITYHFEDKTYVSDPDHVIFLPKGKSYTVTCEKSGIFPLINFYCTEELSENSFFCAKLENKDYYFKAFEALSQTFSLHNSTRNIRSIAAFYDIISHIATELVNADSIVLRPALQYLEANYSDPELNNTKLAQCAHISEVYFRRLFGQIYGMPPRKYIQQLRISRAKELLKNNQLSISEISESCGYSSVYHFCRAFKNIVGKTPGQFRKNSASNWF